MIKYILSLCFCLSLFSVSAHQADKSSSVLAEQDDNTWVLQIKAALTAFQYEIKNKHGDDSYATPEEFQELVLNHVQESINIQVHRNLQENDNLLKDEYIQVTLESGQVRLGHETNVIFIVRGLPESFDEINFTNSSFKNINRNQSALIILKKGYAQKQFVLNNQNNHTAKLIAKDAQFTKVVLANSSAQAMPMYFLGIAGVMLLGLALFLKSKYISKKVTTSSKSRKLTLLK